MSQNAEVDGTVADGIAQGSDTLIGMATLGKTAAALALVIVIILICNLLLRRLGGSGKGRGPRPTLIGGINVGNRERVVIVEVDSTWLVLGVGGGQVNKLHEMPTPPDEATSTATGTGNSGFAMRFARALRQQTTGHDDGPRGTS
ncbi:flagellar biosynthetic protein FliO [Halomonas sabkhae]|uniref:flagellar biosynthetic protein FliO n=1 Tax=Halomonas sabkhae TaxID=626223 RepID=UPI0025B47EE0|nr:flagellar biosynthetic protein FliO [Halomonas sabkhae]MDN3524887.1 flagellar biosynthetic protein FliO [Halomonas sabkhae]